MHILLTGCSSGIGLAIGQRLLALGHEVTGLSRREPPIGHDCFHWIQSDLGVLSAEMSPELGDGEYHAFVHAAGVMHTGRIGEYDGEAALRMWQLHVMTPSLLTEVLVRNRHPLQRIVLIGSRTQQGAVGKSAYSASKAAQQGLVRSWALELMSQGTTVNLIAPGATRTPMLEDPARAGVAPKVPPMGRFIEPGEIAGATAFLLSEDARSITGQTLTICAGASL